MKLKDLIYEYAKMLDSYEDVEKFLTDFKRKNPTASKDEVADAIVQFLYGRGEVEEGLATTALKYILPAIMSIYGSNIGSGIATAVKSKLHAKHSLVTTKKDKNANVASKINYWIKHYAKKYGAPEQALLGILRRETSFHGATKGYNPFVVGDKHNALGPSYGAAQIKPVTAKEVYTQEPEGDVSISSITPDRLTNDVEFNIRTLAKLIGHYYHKEFSKVKNPHKRLQYSLTAYSSGVKAARTRGINSYARDVSSRVTAV